MHMTQMPERRQPTNRLSEVLGLLQNFGNLDAQDTQTRGMQQHLLGEQQQTEQQNEMHPLLVQKLQNELAGAPDERQVMQLHIKDLLRRLQSPYADPGAADAMKAAGYTMDSSLVNEIARRFGLVGEDYHGAQAVDPAKEATIANLKAKGYNVQPKP